MKLFIRLIISGCLMMMSYHNSSAQPVSLSANSGSTTATSDKYGRLAPDSRGWTDPALNPNKMLQAHNTDGMYKLIGTYKVIGSSYLYGEHLEADLFAPEVKAYKIYISYDTYNQEVDFYSASDPGKRLMREPGTLDSFILHQNIDLGIVNPLKFVYGSVLGVKDKYYFQEICTGKRFSLYKRYKSELGYVSGNYGQSELRQFDLEYEYYYTDSEGKGIKKIKPNAASVIKEFKDVKDLSTVTSVDAFTQNPEEAFRKVFVDLNK